MTQEAAARGSAWEVFRVFLRLGATSFGGPAAHLGNFRTELVERRGWLDDREYAELVALCQFLPGPASSQLGFGIGLRRAGSLGALAAFIAFTLPSAVLMVAFAFGASLFSGVLGEGLLAGLKVVAVAIVAQAVWGMARTLAPDRRRAGIAVAAAVAAIALAGSGGQPVAILLGAVGGLFLCRSATGPSEGAGPRSTAPGARVGQIVGVASLGLFALLLALGPLLRALGIAGPSGGVALFDTFFQAGSLVFGGGHVMLPLHTGVVELGWVTEPEFLAGYGAAQAVPGPLFTFAGYLGAVSAAGPGGVPGALLALAAVFLPGFLLLLGVLPLWERLRRRPWAQALIRGAGAAVVGILGAALYSPVFVTAVTGPGPFSLALVCFVLLTAWRTPAWLVVLIGAAGGALLAVLGLH